MEFLIAAISIRAAAANKYYGVQQKEKRGLPPQRTQGSRLSYTVEEVAAMHGVSTKTVYRWIGRGLLPTSKASRKLLIPARSVDNFMEATI
ncbi:MAG TPA: helix-turn-helix domain-containing protein [Chthoniobacterales bacterium]|nr:helix-turn-helix domain-containing protein [Chthoniobacterales bacterium]